LLACTHYPLLKEKIEKHLPQNVKLLSQGEIVTHSLKDYLQRHPEIETKISKERSRAFFTTDFAEDFAAKASIFFGESIRASHVDL
ncbi:MAG: glutamate racemase, partial [Chitinophagaceae bacterium]